MAEDPAAACSNMRWCGARTLLPAAQAQQVLNDISRSPDPVQRLLTLQDDVEVLLVQLQSENVAWAAACFAAALRVHHEQASAGVAMQQFVDNLLLGFSCMTKLTETLVLHARLRMHDSMTAPHTRS